MDGIFIFRQILRLLNFSLHLLLIDHSLVAGLESNAEQNCNRDPMYMTYCIAQCLNITSFNDMQRCTYNRKTGRAVMKPKCSDCPVYALNDKEGQRVRLLYGLKLQENMWTIHCLQIFTAGRISNCCLHMRNHRYEVEGLEPKVSPRNSMCNRRAAKGTRCQWKIEDPSV
ncbi:uncharacterized protein LOC132197509 isoform X3 [Neocloeon triangulifer]|uniref:uncharacterized protein LOC132197509 isoform X3 n=1 Tax=Neocloeon triangulifer TaxID=2078957 RepID=UPI00286ECB3B|nr:uncharacterized protein LOC132197509 isoform X3 [Neocloeon triangulifer]